MFNVFGTAIGTAIGYKGDILFFGKRDTIGETVAECSTLWDLRVSEIRELKKAITNYGLENAVTFDITTLRS